LWEEEVGEDSNPVSTVTLFLTNKECPYRCLMCDLWQNTLDESIPSGAISEQIRYALAHLPEARQIKLYNAGSFFDPKAIPTEDYAEIAQTVLGFERVIVECHPRLIGPRTLRFRELLAGRLEVAIGLETVHSGVLERLNKRFTVEDFEKAVDVLRKHDISLRVFLLLRPPFMTEGEGIFWAQRTLDVAFDAGAGICCIIPTRGGNGAMEALADVGEYAPPSLDSLEQVFAYGLQKKRGRVVADLWDVEKFFTCDCSPLRANRLEKMNRTQSIPPAILCTRCGNAKGDG
jgi:radical SAM enzyme (TIGR01210 family)